MCLSSWAFRHVPLYLQPRVRPRPVLEAWDLNVSILPLIRAQHHRIAYLTYKYGNNWLICILYSRKILQRYNHVHLHLPPCHKDTLLGSKRRLL